RAVFPYTLVFLERLVLSIFVSVIVAIGIGTILGAFFLFESAANVLLLSSFTIFFAFLGSYRASRLPDKSLTASGDSEEESLHPIPR
ncbi:MAG TPA: hypothetical protein VE177_04150, partial [Candidatus Binatus sp.]|nr:hypothetical protein [Candidatus Binatus sp.]